MRGSGLVFGLSRIVGDEAGRVVAATVANGVVAYFVMVVVLRTSGKRTLSGLNAFDFVVSVAIGSVLASTLVARSTTALQGLVAVGVLVGGQWLIAWASVRVRFARRLTRSEPVVLVANGEVDHDALGRQRLTEGELRQAVRAAGFGGFDVVGVVVMETNGSFSVIGPDALGDRSALADDEA